MTPTKDEILDLKKKANKARELLITTLVEAGTGHSAGPLDMADIFTAMYFYILHHNPQNPDMEDRDRLILSNGHICPIRYVSMAMSGYFPIEELKTLRKINSRLQGHPHRLALPGLETSSGPLGEGLGQSVGIALAARMDHKSYYTYCLTSDGEHQEGIIWEAVMTAGNFKLDHLIQIVDYNNIQIDGNVPDVMSLEPFKQKYESFNWNVIEIDGNNMEDIIYGVGKAKQSIGKPTLIIAHTIPGKGVSFIENNYLWHGKVPSIEEAQKALAELEGIEEKLSL